MTSLNLERLRTVTGVFISELIFQVITLEYLDYLKDRNMEDTETFAEEFCKDWKTEQEIFGTFLETSDGNIKYYCMDCADANHPITTEEFLNGLDRGSYNWESRCRSFWDIFEKILITDHVDKQLLKNILLKRTISYRQIYEIDKAIKDRAAELSVD